MKLKRIFCAVLLIGLALALPIVLNNAVAIDSHTIEEKDEMVKIEHRFKEWTEAFNRKDLKGSCDFFSKDVVATYQGLPQKNYKTICEGFEKIFKETAQQYQNSYEIQNIYVLQNLAAVRITWYQQTFDNGRARATLVEQGIDILKKNENHQWQIVNFIAFPENTRKTTSTVIE